METKLGQKYNRWSRRQKREMEERIMLRSMSKRRKEGKQAHRCACALKAALRLKKQSEIRANDRASAGTLGFEREDSEKESKGIEASQETAAGKRERWGWVNDE